MSELTVVPITGLPHGKQPFAPLCRQTSLPVAVSNDPDHYAQGLSDGQSVAQAAFAVERERLVQLIASAEALRPEDNAETAFLLGNAIRMIVAKIVGDVAFDSALMARQIDDAIALSLEADLARTICLHPDDLALFAKGELPLDCKADPELPRSGIRIECSAGWVEHGPAFALKRLERLLNGGDGL
jgi:flagellar assembly protein FliH